MKRSEFLKRLGLGAVAVVAAPVLLAKEEKHSCSVKLGDECLADVGEAKKLVFWNNENGSNLCATAFF